MRVSAAINDRIESGGDQIGYDTLMQVYQEMINTPHEIVHMDRLLMSLISKRNVNPRVDQMILILSAKVLGQSKYPVPNVSAIFESVLSQDDRLSDWVLAFVAEAIVDYGHFIPKGDDLVDLTNSKSARLASRSGPRKEFFGSHFLPPPKGDYIQSYIQGIPSRTLRETERNHYYLLISAGYSEPDIEAALRRLQASGIPPAGKADESYLKYLSKNRNQIIQH